MLKMTSLPNRDDYLYQSRYCEENIWHLCQQPEFRDSNVVVIASRTGFFPILRQRAARSPDEPMLWDYHVVLLWHAAQGHQYILDFDTRLPFCTLVEDYFQQSFIAEERLRPEYVPLFRVMPAEDYIAKLRSDRRHMKTENGWLAEPPPWPPISSGESNLDKFTDMRDPEFGRILTARQLLSELNQAHTD